MKKKYLLITMIAIMALTMCACGSKSNTNTDTTEDNIEAIKNEIIPTTESASEDAKLIIENSSSNASEDASDDASSNASSDCCSKNKTTYECAPNVNIAIPEGYGVTNDNTANDNSIVLSKDDIKVIVNMKETEVDVNSKLQSKLTDVINNPEAPFEAFTSEKYKGAVCDKETYTVIKHYKSNIIKSNIYIIKSTFDISDTACDGTVCQKESKCYYYFVASNIKTGGKMMIARTSDIQEDSTAITLCESIFTK